MLVLSVCQFGRKVTPAVILLILFSGVGFCRFNIEYSEQVILSNLPNYSILSFSV